ncbi:MAG: amidohydrolase [Opitutus sp.]|nr:amidohydrolase [Opitutus sp.]
MLLIDSHTHPIFLQDGRGRKQAPEFIRRARRAGIDHLVALGDVLRFGRSPNRAQLRQINDDTVWLMERFPGFVTGFCYLNPTLGERAVRDEIARCLANHSGFRGIKLEIANNAADACMGSVMEEAERHGLVVLQHAWSQTKIRERAFHTDPEDVATLARRFPRVKIIMAHLTGCGFRGVVAVKFCPNVWIDTSGAAPEAGLVEYAVAQLGAERVLHGSDAPIRDFGVSLARVRTAEIPRQAQRRILGENVRELLRLP